MKQQLYVHLKVNHHCWYTGEHDEVQVLGPAALYVQSAGGQVRRATAWLLPLQRSSVSPRHVHRRREVSTRDRRRDRTGAGRD